MLNFRGTTVSVYESPVHPSLVFLCTYESIFLSFHHCPTSPIRSVPWGHARTWHTVFNFCIFSLLFTGCDKKWVESLQIEIWDSLVWRKWCYQFTNPLCQTVPLLAWSVKIQMINPGNPDKPAWTEIISAHWSSIISRHEDGCNERESSY